MQLATTVVRPGRRPASPTRTAFRAAADLPPQPTRRAVLAAMSMARSRRPATPEAAAHGGTRVWPWDARIETSSYVLLSYLYRRGHGEKWAGRGGSGRYACSIAQLVMGVAPLMGWEGTRSELLRDHRRSVERWLDWLQDAGLVDHQPQQDDQGYWWRTIITLNALTEVDEALLREAGERLKDWPKMESRRRYRGRGRPEGRRRRDLTVLCTHARLTRRERRRRAVERRRRGAQATRRRRAQTESSLSVALLPHPYGAPESPKGALSEKNSLADSANPPNLRSVRRTRTRECVPRKEPAVASSANAPPVLKPAETSSPNEGGPGGPVDLAFPVDAFAARLEQAVQRVEERRPVFELKERQELARAAEVAGWGLDRHWPIKRLQAAFVVVRYGPAEASLSGYSRAGGLVREQLDRDDPNDAFRRRRDDYLTLRRAVASYERHHAAAQPEFAGYPAGGLAGFLHMVALSVDEPGSPATLAYAIGAFAILARRMRAHATHDDPTRHARQVKRAQGRRSPRPATWWRQAEPAWPAWAALADDGLPIVRLSDRYVPQLVVVEVLGTFAPSAACQLEVLRDATLLRYGSLSSALDGRTQMALRDLGQLEPEPRREPVDPRLLELARLTGMKLRTLGGFAVRYIDSMLPAARADRRRTEEAERDRRARERADRYEQPE